MKLRSLFAVFAVTTGMLAVCPAPSAWAQEDRPRAQGFPDVPKDHWAADAVRMLSERGILQGYPRGTAQRASDRGYQGDRPVTRYELATALWRFIQYIERADAQKRGGAGVKADPLPEREAVKRLIAGEYLPKNTPLAADPNKPVTANQLADALAQVIVKVTERRTPITPGSRHAPDDPPAEDKQPAR